MIVRHLVIKLLRRSSLVVTGRRLRRSDPAIVTYQVVGRDQDWLEWVTSYIIADAAFREHLAFYAERGSLHEMASELLSEPKAAYGEYVSQSVVKKAWQAHQSGLRNYTGLLWAVAAFELWARRFLCA